MRTQYNQITFEIIIRKLIQKFSLSELGIKVDAPYPLNGTWKSDFYESNSKEYKACFYVSNESFLYPMLISEIEGNYGSTRVSPFLTFDKLLEQEPKVIDNISNPLIQYTLICSCPLTDVNKVILKKAISSAHKDKFGIELNDIDFQEIPVFGEMTKEDLEAYLK